MAVQYMGGSQQIIITANAFILSYHKNMFKFIFIGTTYINPIGNYSAQFYWWAHQRCFWLSLLKSILFEISSSLTSLTCCTIFLITQKQKHWQPLFSVDQFTFKAPISD